MTSTTPPDRSAPGWAPIQFLGWWCIGHATCALVARIMGDRELLGIYSLRNWIPWTLMPWQAGILWLFLELLAGIGSMLGVSAARRYLQVCSVAGTLWHAAILIFYTFIMVSGAITGGHAPPMGVNYNVEAIGAMVTLAVKLASFAVTWVILKRPSTAPGELRGKSRADKSRIYGIAFGNALRGGS